MYTDLQTDRQTIRQTHLAQGSITRRFQIRRGQEARVEEHDRLIEVSDVSNGGPFAGKCGIWG